MSLICKAVSCGMAFMLASGCIVPASARTPGIYDGEYTHNQQEGSDSNVDVNVLVQNRTVPVIFSAYVPATVKIAVSRDKQVITPENLRIINGVDTLPIGVWDVKSRPVNSWTILDYNTDFKDKNMTDQKKFAMKLNGSDLKYYANGLPWEIEPAGELPLNLEAKIPYQSTAKDMEEIMTVSFTMDWMDRVDPPDGKPHATGDEIDKAMLKNELGQLTGKISFSRERAPLTNTVPLNADHSVVAVKDPNGKDAVVYSVDGGGVFAPVDSSYLFTNSIASYPGNSTPFNVTAFDLSGLDTSRVKNMGAMFINSKANYLDVSTFNTTNCTLMGCMFWGSRATKIDGLTSFYTADVTDMNCMFWNTLVSTLDLSSFDTKKNQGTNSMFGNMPNMTMLDLSNFDMCSVTDARCMFTYSYNMKKVYCYDQASLNKMVNSLSCHASGFVVGRP